VDSKATPIQRITPTGLETTQEKFEFDIIIYATGFDALRGAFDRIDFRGKGGVKLSDSEVIMPDPILVGRSEAKLAALAARTGVKRYTTDLDAALKDKHNVIYFDATLTGQRPVGVRKAIAAGKHI
jgi:hypothetical protein